MNPYRKSERGITLIGAVVLMSLALASIGIGQTEDEGPRYSHSGPIIISGARIIDGLGNDPIENQDVLLDKGKIAAIGPAGSIDAPPNAEKIDGEGLTAMPGLIDMHIHVQGGWCNGLIAGKKYAPTYDDATVQQRLSGYVYAGVTTVLDVGNDHDFVVKTRNRVNDGELFGPRFFACGAAWSQAPSGWDAAGTSGNFGLSTKVTTLAGIPKQMDRYTEDGIEIIKLYSGISVFAAQRVTKVANSRGIQVVADLWGLNLNRGIMERTGLNGWAHSGAFVKVPEADHKWMAENDRYVITTANVGEKLAGARVKDEKGAQLMKQEPLILDIWGMDVLDEFYRVYPQIRNDYYEGPDAFYQQSNFGDLSKFRDTMLHNIKASFDAGVLLAGGTDDIYASLWPGESMHREMELLVMAGIPEIDAIQICTYNGAKVLRREKKFGSLRTGLSADLLIVEGNPAENISDSRKVRHVFVRGNRVDRDSLKLKE